jgi:hypothetical protein
MSVPQTLIKKPLPLEKGTGSYEGRTLAGCASYTILKTLTKHIQ